MTVDDDRWLDRPGARLRWRDGGQGPTLLLLHGWALDLTLFEPFVAAARTSLRLVRFDRRGYGRSSGEPALPTDVEDAFATLDAASVARVVFLVWLEVFSAATTGCAESCTGTASAITP